MHTKVYVFVLEITTYLSVGDRGVFVAADVGRVCDGREGREGRRSDSSDRLSANLRPSASATIFVQRSGTL